MSICPRCQRPLEDEAPYICCAGQELRCRCADCPKVSEGFAFPYGMCPHCKGQLVLLDRGPIDDDQAMEAVRKAFESELGGRAFDEGAARDTPDPVLQELFHRFAAMEAEHMAILSERYHADTSVAQLKGSLSQQSCPDPAAFERANYMKALQSYSSEFV